MSGAHARELERAAIGRARSGNLGLHDALKLFDELLLHARPASVRALNQLLSVVSRAKCSSSSKLAVSRFNRMLRDCSNKVAPDCCTYSIVIGCFCRIGRLELGFAAFGLILKTGWRVDDIVVNQLLKGLCDTKRVGEAMHVLLRQMPEVGCRLGVVSYNTLLKGLCDRRRAEEARELLHMMVDGQDSSCSPDVVSYNTVIKGFFNEGQVDKAYSLFLEMGVSPNVVTYTTIIDGLCKAQSVDKADGVKPDHDTYNCLIHGYLSTRQWEEVVRRLKEMSTRGLEPDVFTYGLLLDYLCENGNCSEARIFLIL